MTLDKGYQIPFTNSIRYQINDDRTYYFSGTAGHDIRVTGGKPNVYRMQQDADWEAGAEYKYGINIE